MKIYVCHSTGYDYVNELYKPIRASSLNTDHEIFLPHENLNGEIDTMQITKDADLIIAEVSYPSTGQGIELGRAEMIGKRIVCLHQADKTPNSALRFVTGPVISYKDAAEMIRVVAELLQKQT